MADTRTAYARSVFSDPQNILYAINIFLASLALPEVVQVIPATWLPLLMALSGVLGIILRTVKGTNPVALIPPGEVKPVEVPKLVATIPPTTEKK